jgi:hypothetical protein
MHDRDEDSNQIKTAMHMHDNQQEGSYLIRNKQPS